MRILVTSDWHTDAMTAGIDRGPDVEEAVDETINAAIREKADLYLFLGDLCDPDGVRSHRAAAVGVRAAAALLREGIRSRWLVGNHDVIEDGSGTNTLAGIAAMYPIAADGDVVVWDSPCSEVIPVLPAELDAGSVLLVALPFTPRSHAYDPAAFVEILPPHLGPVIVAGHLNIEGIGPGSETIDMPRGRDVFFPLEAVKKRFPKALMLNGHYHTRQTFNGIVIPGSLERLTFGEEKNEPGYLIVEV